MLKKILAFAPALAAALALLSCATARYIGPIDHVDYRDAEKPKTSREQSALDEGINPMVNTYDEEYAYDDKGNLLKTAMTEYIDRLSSVKKFIVWETESKVIGGKLVPCRVSANGVPFMEIEYELLTVTGNGAVVEDISERNFIRIQGSMWSGMNVHYWDLALDNFTVSFPADDKFVKEVRRYNSTDGVYYENALTLGYDNLVLKRFHYSRESLFKGIAKSYTGYNYESQRLRQLAKGENVDYTYEWKVIGDKICQVSMNYESQNVKLSADEEYDSSGKRTKETWFLSDPKNNNDKPREIFEQTLTY